MGEIGRAVYEFYGQYHKLDGIDIDKEKNTKKKFRGTYDILCICVPFVNDFVKEVNAYIANYQPNCVIVFSSVATGTCRKIGDNVVHCPIEGKHPHLKESLKNWAVMMGGYNEYAWEFFKKAGKIPFIYENPEITETLKLLSTSFYGLCLEYYRYAARCLKECGGVGSEFRVYNTNYNVLYDELGMKRFTRPLLDTPEGVLGGHCVLQNLPILDNTFPEDFNKRILEINNNEAWKESQK